jgi:hypothetical protein
VNPDDASIRHLLGRLAVVEATVRSRVARRRAADPNPDDPFRGLYLSDEHVDALLANAPAPVAIDETANGLLRNVEHEADLACVEGHDLRLRRLAKAFELIEFDIAVLLIALAPDLDPRFEHLFGYLQDDVTRRRASVGLALELTGVSPVDAEARYRLSESGLLAEMRLITFEESERHFLTRALRVPDRVVSHLLGDDRPDPLVAELVTKPPEVDVEAADALARAVSRGARFCYLRGGSDAPSFSLAADALSRTGLSTLVLDLGRLTPGDDRAEIAAAAIREARLWGTCLVAGPIECLGEQEIAALRVLTEHRWPVVLTGMCGWDPAWSCEAPLVVDVPAASPSQRERVWRASLDGSSFSGVDPSSATASFRLGVAQIRSAAASARLIAASADRPITASDLRAAARAQNSARLERLARRIEPQVGWSDIVLPNDILGELHELAARVRHRDVVLGDWQMRRGGGRGRGVTALFAGESGTGKTLAAEVVAGEFGLDLYTIDLSTVVDKYIGETEKNLDRIFAEAENVNGLLFFDEADALFGRRSEVRDAHDRYANVEVAYLLQRFDAFDGTAILATNLRSNVDEAFTRRLDSIVEFPMPDEDHRRRLWEVCLGSVAPRRADLDIGFCARSFQLSGGNIRNVAVAAAYLAADAGREIQMGDLIRGIELEYRKLGRLLVESEFGPYLADLSRRTRPNESLPK